MKSKLISFFSKMISEQNSKLKNISDVDGLYGVYRDFDSSCSKESFKEGLKGIFAEFLKVNQKCFSKKFFNKSLSSVLACFTLVSGICNTSAFAQETSKKPRFLSSISIKSIKERANVLKNKALDLKEGAVDRFTKTKDKCVSYCKDHPYSVGFSVGGTVFGVATGLTLLTGGYLHKHNQYKNHNDQSGETLVGTLKLINLDARKNDDLKTAVGNIRLAYRGQGFNYNQRSINNVIKNIPKQNIIEEFMTVVRAQTSLLKDFCADEIKYEDSLHIKSKNYDVLCELRRACESLNSLPDMETLVEVNFEHISDRLDSALDDVIKFGHSNKDSMFGNDEALFYLDKFRKDFRGLFTFRV